MHFYIKEIYETGEILRPFLVRINLIDVIMWKINAKQNKDVYMVALRDEGKLIGYYEKHEYRNVETMKQYDLC